MRLALFDCAVQHRKFVFDFLHADNCFARFVVRVDKLFYARHVVHDDVVAEKHRKRFVPDKVFRKQYCPARPVQGFLRDKGDFDFFKKCFKFRRVV